MQLAVTALIDAARSRFATKAPISPMAPAAESIQPQRRPTAFAPLESTLTTHELFARSPLSAETNPVIVDLIGTIFRDESVQRAAGACAAKRLRLTELAGFKSEISAAIQIAVANDEDLDIANFTPAVVAEVLRQRAEDIDSAIDDCREDHAAHQAASAARMRRHEPLRAAVSKRLSQLVSERDYLVQADDSARRAAAIGISGSSRFAILRSAGLTDEQIAATEPTATNPEVLAECRRIRIAEIGPQIEKLCAFGASPTFDAAPLAGLGFEDLISARDHATPEAA